MNDTDRQFLFDLRKSLLHLHKTLLDWERAAYERVHGRVSPTDLLQATMEHPQFAWLRPISELIVRIDESVDTEAQNGPVDVAAIVARARAATAQFVVGLIMLTLFAALSRQSLPAGADIARAPWWMWTGGLFGAFFILMAVVTTPVLGAALMLASSIVGQLSAALVIDHFGLFGATVVPISTTRVLGVLLLAAGVMLIRWT